MESIGLQLGTFGNQVGVTKRGGQAPPNGQSWEVSVTYAFKLAQVSLRVNGTGVLDRSSTYLPGLSGRIRSHSQDLPPKATSPPQRQGKMPTIGHISLWSISIFKLS